MLSFFPLDVLDGFWDVIESVSEGFLAYFWKRHIVIHAIMLLAGKLCVNLLLLLFNTYVCKMF